MLGTLHLCSVGWILDRFSHGALHRAEQILSVGRSSPFRSFEFMYKFLTRKHLCSFSMSSAELLAGLWGKSKARQAVPVPVWDLPSGSSAAAGWLRSSCGWGPRAAQHGPEGHSGGEAQHRLDLFGLAVVWVADS